MRGMAGDCMLREGTEKGGGRKVVERDTVYE